MINRTLTLAVLLVPGLALAETVTFDTDPFAGSNAKNEAGRQVVSLNERSLPIFSPFVDTFAFDVNVPDYAAVGALSFINSNAAGLPKTGVNTIVLLDTDNDNDPTTAFNAGAAANLIAASLDDVVTPGFFVYWNSSLLVNRLVYSTDLSVNTADLSILARIQSPTGQAAINELQYFNSSNFQTVPEPATMVALGAAIAAFARKRRA